MSHLLLLTLSLPLLPFTARWDRIVCKWGMHFLPTSSPATPTIPFGFQAWSIETHLTEVIRHLSVTKSSGYFSTFDIIDCAVFLKYYFILPLTSWFSLTSQTECHRYLNLYNSQNWIHIVTFSTYFFFPIIYLLFFSFTIRNTEDILLPHLHCPNPYTYCNPLYITWLFLKSVTNPHLHYQLHRSFHQPVLICLHPFCSHPNVIHTALRVLLINSLM